MSKLTNKTALITGGNSGMGFATAEAFIANGAEVIITGRNEDKLEDAVSKLGSKASYILADSGKMDDLRNLAKKSGGEKSPVGYSFLECRYRKICPIKLYRRRIF